MQAEEIAKIVGEVLKSLESQEGLDWSSPVPKPADGGDQVVFPTVDAAVATAARAQRGLPGPGPRGAPGRHQSHAQDRHRQRGALGQDGV